MASGGPAGPRLVRLSLVPVLLVPIRLGCGLAVLGLATAVGGRSRSEFLAFALGALLAGLFLSADPRRRHWPEPEPLPAGAELQPWPAVVRSQVYPSTVAVTGLGLVALAFEPTLAALLAGVLGGMAGATAVAWLEIASVERRLGGVLFGERGSGRLYLS